MCEFMSILVFSNRNADFDEPPHYDIDAKNSKCPGSLEVCCRHPDGLPYTPKVVPPPPPQEPEGPNDVDIDGPVESHCGRRNKNGLGVSIRWAALYHCYFNSIGVIDALANNSPRCLHQ